MEDEEAYSECLDKKLFKNISIVLTIVTKFSLHPEVHYVSHRT